jgi:hypothetical protein
MKLAIVLLAAAVADSGVQAEVLQDLQPVLVLASTLEAKKVDKIEGDPVARAATAGDNFARAYDKLKIAMTQVTAASEAQKDQKLNDAAASAASARATLQKAQKDVDAAESLLQVAEKEADDQQKAFLAKHPLGSPLETPESLATATAMKRRVESTISAIQRGLRSLKGLKAPTSPSSQGPKPLRESFLQDDEESLVALIGKQY